MSNKEKNNFIIKNKNKYEDFRFKKNIFKLFEVLNLSLADFKVYAVLTFYSDWITGECYPSLSTIQQKSNISRKQVVASIKSLSDNGLILKRERVKDVKKQKNIDFNFLGKESEKQINSQVCRMSNLYTITAVDDLIENLNIRQEIEKHTYFNIRTSVFEVFNALNLTLADFKVYTVLARFSNWETGECFPSFDTISKISNISRRAVINSIKRLTDTEIINKEKSFNYEKGFFDSNLYILNDIQKIKIYSLSQDYDEELLNVNNEKMFIKEKNIFELRDFFDNRVNEDQEGKAIISLNNKKHFR